MHKRIQGWAKRHPLKALVALSAVSIGLTVMWLVVALGPDSLLDDECSALRTNPCIKSHTAAWIWAAVSGVFAVFFGIQTWRRFARARAIEDEHDRKP